MGCRRRGESLLALGSGCSLVSSVWCEWQWVEGASFVQMLHGFLGLAEDLQAKLRLWQVLAGAGESVKAMWDVR